LIRRAHPDDIGFLTELAVMCANTNYPELVPSRDGIKGLVTKAISSPQCMTLISSSTESGPPQGGLISLCHDGVWFERKVSSLALIWTPVRGDGIRMLRAWKKFAYSRPAFKVVEVGFPVGGELGKIIYRLGIRPRGTHYVNMR